MCRNLARTLIAEGMRTQSMGVVEHIISPSADHAFESESADHKQVHEVCHQLW